MESDTMNSAGWVLMEDECFDGDCGGAPPLFHIPPPPIPPDFPCEMFADMEMTCPSLLNASDNTEYKKIGSFPTGLVIAISLAVPTVILLALLVFFWRKRRKGVGQTKDFDQNGPTMMNGNGILYEDLTHARPRGLPLAPPIEMYDVNTHQGGNGTIGGPKMDFSYFLNPPPIYEELPDHLSEGLNPQEISDEEFAEDELSVIDVPMNGGGNIELSRLSGLNNGGMGGTGRKLRSSAGSLNQKSKRNGGGRMILGNGGTVGNYKAQSQKSLDRRNGGGGGRGNNLKYPGTTPRPAPPYTRPSYLQDNNAYVTSNGLTMKIPPHLVAALCNGAANNGARPYEVIQTTMLGQPMNMMGRDGGIYPVPSSRSSGSSYGDGSSSASSARNNQGGNSIESSDSGFIPSFSYDHGGLPPNYAYGEYALSGNPAPYAQQQANGQSFRRFRMANVDKNHPLYSNHLLT